MQNNRINQSLKTWNRIAESFDHTRQYTWDFCITYISTLNQDSTCVDLGCGNGRHLLPLAQQCYHAIGFDISDNLLRITAQKLQQNHITNTSLIQGDLCTLPFNQNRIDHGIYIAALHNIDKRKNRIQSLKELYRILKPNGTALISVWSKNQKRFRQKINDSTNTRETGDIILYWRQHNLNIPRFYHLYEKEEFKQDILQADFQIQSFQEICIATKETMDNYYAIVRK
jgi:ubiquinone/menaquinone biosynthesis C-methylase UbiE